MGLGLSKKAPTPQEGRRQELEARGVLIPPSFGIFSSFEPAKNNTPSYLHQLRQLDPSKRILGDHFEAGLLQLAADSSLGCTRVGVNVAEGRARLLGHLHGLESTLARASTTDAPSLTTEIPLLSKNLNLYGNISARRSGWLAAIVDGKVSLAKRSSDDKELDYYRNDPFSSNTAEKDDASKVLYLKLGLWSPFKDAFPTMSTPKPIRGPLIDQVRGFAAASCLGATGAVGFKMNLQTMEPIPRYYLQINLNDDKRMPLVLSLEKSRHMTSLGLSQVLTLDRYQLNPMEDRAPLVRNTVAWALRMQTSTAGDPLSMSEQSTVTSKNNDPQVTVGGAWQINRNLALKAKVQDQALHTCLVIKQWKQPRLLLSLIHRREFGSSSTHKSSHFVGVSLELETGRLSATDLYATGKAVDDGKVPATIAVLPTEEPSS